MLYTATRADEAPSNAYQQRELIGEKGKGKKVAKKLGGHPRITKAGLY